MKNRLACLLLTLITMFVLVPGTVMGADVDYNKPDDSDHDGLSDQQEQKYSTNPSDPDTDDDGYVDGDEVYHGYDPLISGSARLPKTIDVNLKEQRLRYSHGEYGEQGSFLISSGKRGYKTPPGSYIIDKKSPKVSYRGVDSGKTYNYPNTKWNLQFLPHYYIHGAYWHKSFGTPVSHGCVNVAYSDMEGLYNFADIGTSVTIHY